MLVTTSCNAYRIVEFSQMIEKSEIEYDLHQTELNLGVSKSYSALIWQFDAN